MNTLSDNFLDSNLINNLENEANEVVLFSDHFSANKVFTNLEKEEAHIKTQNDLAFNVKKEVEEINSSSDNLNAVYLVSKLECEVKEEILFTDCSSTNNLLANHEKIELILDPQNSSLDKSCTSPKTQEEENGRLFNNSLADLFLNPEKEVEEINHSVHSLNIEAEKISDTTRHDLSNDVNLLSELINFKQYFKEINKTFPFDSSFKVDNNICVLAENIKESAPSLTGKSSNKKSAKQIKSSDIQNIIDVNSNPKLLEGIVCEKLFTAKVSLKKLQILVDTVYICNICYQFFKSKTSLCRHRLSHTDRPLLKQLKIYRSKEELTLCKICGKLFTTKSKLKEHMRSHSDERPFPCNICNKPFKTSGKLKEHLVFHFDVRRYPCIFCDKRCKTSSNLKCHMATHSKEKPFVCKYCEKCFKTLVELNQHLKSHSEKRPFVCDICQKSCKSKGNLKHHLLSHSNEKPFLCEICGKTFKTIHVFNQHLKYHSDESKSDISKTKYKLDQQIVSQPEEKVFLCHLCEKSFEAIPRLNVHMLSHSDKSFVCETCNKSFKTKPELKQHLISHSDVRPFVCHVCEKACKTKGNLRAHMLIHNG